VSAWGWSGADWKGGVCWSVPPPTRQYSLSVMVSDATICNKMTVSTNIQRNFWGQGRTAWEIFVSTESLDYGGMPPACAHRFPFFVVVSDITICNKTTLWLRTFEVEYLDGAKLSGWWDGKPPLMGAKCLLPLSLHCL
jgi:hypothetical protein